MITSRNLVHHEFIGLNVHATSKNNESLNLKGTIIDETKNTIKIEGLDNIERVVPKNGSIFVFELPKGSVLKAIPMLNYKSGFGVGAMTRFSSGTNHTMAAYGSAMDKFFVLGAQKLDDKLNLEYSMNSYMNEWFLGRRRPKYGASIVYKHNYSTKDFLLKDYIDNIRKIDNEFKKFINVLEKYQGVRFRVKKEKSTADIKLEVDNRLKGDLNNQVEELKKMMQETFNDNKINFRKLAQSCNDPNYKNFEREILKNTEILTTWMKQSVIAKVNNTTR